MHLLLAATLIAIAPMSKGAHSQAAAMSGKLERRLLESPSVTVQRLDVNAAAQSLDENWEERVRNAVTAIAAEPAPRSLVLFVEYDSASLRDMLERAAEPDWRRHLSGRGSRRGAPRCGQDVRRGRKRHRCLHHGHAR